jgi:hypothetical protein
VELLGDVGHMESHFGPFGDSVSVGARLEPGLRQTYDRLRNRSKHTRWYSYIMRLKWKLNSVRLEIMLILTQDRCTVWVNRIEAQKSFCTHQMELLGDMGHVESLFGSLGDSVNVGVR